MPPERRAGRKVVPTSRAVVRLTEDAVADLRRLQRLDPQIVRWAHRKMLLLERDPFAGQPLHGALAGWRKLVLGDRHWRIVWRVIHGETGEVRIDVAEVWAVGARSDDAVYDEMRDRVQQLRSSPATTALTDAIERLRTAAQRLPPPLEESVDPVPAWLVARLVQQVGLAPDVVAQLTLEAAVDRWVEWTNRLTQE